MPTPGTRTQSVFFTVGVTLTLATEVVVCTLPGVNTDNAGQTVSLEGTIEVTTIAAATTLTLRIRRQSLTGTQVGTGQPITTAASSVFTLTLAVDDTPGEVASMPYVLTAQQAGAASTANQGSLVALVR